MSEQKNSKLKFLLIIPILAGIIFFATSLTESDMSENPEARERLLAQFAINYEAMMAACSEENLSQEELKSCLDAFDEVREFCVVEPADQCGDKRMEQLEQKLSDI